MYIGFIFFIFIYSLCFFAMLLLSRRIEKQLIALGEDIKKRSNAKLRFYEFECIEDKIYAISPCPPNYDLLRKLSNVVWVGKDEPTSRLFVKIETYMAIEDLVMTLNSGLGG